ncbi:maleylpyruvate isomerase family mycothiol-dependent enzyme [Streptomyces sp. NPDC057623]|uniref:maleylpyruvate isomerase family mycothiol-dependent enzyme n=1 Tax=Streptomyces sp. NPDC057623 TaxID=3346187 RepID=UPI003682F807
MSARQWMDHGTQLFLATVDSLSDGDLDAPSALPDWNRRHLIAHVHYNAEALRRLVSWARTGRESAMYPSPGHRDAEIQAGSRLAPEELRRLVRDSAKELAEDVGALPQRAWSHEVRTAQGRTVPATEILWLRTREVFVHAIDLDAGVGFDDLPADLLRALIDDTLGRRTAAGHAPALARWLTGRTSRAPDLGPWL